MLWTDRAIRLPFFLSLSLVRKCIAVDNYVVPRNCWQKHYDACRHGMQDHVRRMFPSPKNRDWRAGFKRRGERRSSMLVGWFDGSASASGFLNASRYACVGGYVVFLVRCLCVKRGIIKMIYAANCFDAADEMVCDICGTWE